MPIAPARADGAQEPGAGARVLGPLAVSAEWIVRLDCAPRASASPGLLRDKLLLCLPVDAAVSLSTGQGRRRCEPGDGLLLDLNRRWTIDAGDGAWCHVLTVPAVFLAFAAPERMGSGVVAASAGLAAIRVLLRAALALAGPVSPAEEYLIVSAIQDLLAAAFVPEAAGQRTLALRTSLLLDRAIAHVDEQLGGDLTVEGVCAVLGCSRSALYRATAPVGGIAELIVRRRLAAAYRCLTDPADRRPIAAIAAAHGFADSAQFSRRFRATFGTSARQVRETGGHRRG